MSVVYIQLNPRDPATVWALDGAPHSAELNTVVAAYESALTAFEDAQSAASDAVQLANTAEARHQEAMQRAGLTGAPKPKKPDVPALAAEAAYRLGLYGAAHKAVARAAAEVDRVACEPGVAAEVYAAIAAQIADLHAANVAAAAEYVNTRAGLTGAVNLATLTALSAIYGASDEESLYRSNRYAAEGVTEVLRRLGVVAPPIHSVRPVPVADPVAEARRFDFAASIPGDIDAAKDDLVQRAKVAYSQIEGANPIPGWVAGALAADGITATRKPAAKGRLTGF